MKKIISLIICVIMLITAVVFSQSGNQSLGGKGVGKNQKIKTQEEFSNVLNSAVSLLSFLNTDSNSGKSLLKEDNAFGVFGVLSLDKSSVSETESLKTLKDDFLNSGIKYSGMTIRQELSSKSTMEVEYPNGNAYADQDISGICTMYMTQKAVLVDMDVSMKAYSFLSADQTKDGVAETSDILIDMVLKLYIDREDVYMMIDEYYVFASQGDEVIGVTGGDILSVIHDEWIDVGGLSGVGAYIELIQELFLNGMSSSLKYYDEYYDKHADNFEKSGKRYYLSGNDFVEFLKDMPDDYIDSYGNIEIISYDDVDDIEGSFELDLSKSDCPVLTQDFSGNYTMKESGAKCIQKWDISENMIFNNIGNTAVKKPQDVIDIDELEELFDD